MASNSKAKFWIAIYVVAIVLAVAVLVADGTGSRQEHQHEGDGVTTARTDYAREASTGTSAKDGGEGRKKQERQKTAPGGEVVWFVPWGDGPGQLGKKEPEEGNPEGPMSFWTDGVTTVVLDQVNERLCRFERDKFAGCFDIGSGTFQDVAFDTEGRAWLLDRLAGRKVSVLGPDGKLLAEFPLEGGPVAEGGGVTGIFLYDDGCWVEIEHGKMVKIATADLKATDRVQRAGRLSRDGLWLLAAALRDRQTAGVFVRPAARPLENPKLLAEVRFEIPVLHLLMLEGTGRSVFLGARLAEFSRVPPYGLERTTIEIVEIGMDGRSIRRIELQAPELELEQFRPLVLGKDGKIYQLWFGNDGVELRRAG